MTSVHEAITEAQDAASALTRDDHLLLVEAIDSLLSLAYTAAHATGQPTYSAQVNGELRAVREKLRAAVA